MVVAALAALAGLVVASAIVAQIPAVLRLARLPPRQRWPAVLDRGDHAGVMARGGLYAERYSLQARGVSRAPRRAAT